MQLILINQSDSTIINAVTVTFDQPFAIIVLKLFVIEILIIFSKMHSLKVLQESSLEPLRN